MKYLLLITLTVISTHTHARRCVADSRGEMNFANRCLIAVQSTWTPQCNAGRAAPHLPLTWGFADFIDPYLLVSAAKTVSYCNVEIEECKDLALRELEKFERTNNCGATTVGESATFDYQTLGHESEVLERITGRFQR